MYVHKKGALHTAHSVTRPPSCTQQVAWWRYALLSIADVEANYFVVLAYQYTSITSVMLIDCFTIPCVMLLSRCFLHVKVQTLLVACPSPTNAHTHSMQRLFHCPLPIPSMESVTTLESHCAWLASAASLPLMSCTSPSDTTQVAAIRLSATCCACWGPPFMPLATLDRRL